MNKKEDVLNLFHNNLNCAQSILFVFGNELGIDGNTAKSLATGFGSGIATTQQICGALTGAVMALGAKYFDGDNIAESKEKVYQKSNELLNRFKEKNKTTNCINLLGTDISTEKGLNFAKEKNMFNLKCKKYLSDVCDILDEIL